MEKHRKHIQYLVTLLLVIFLSFFTSKYIVQLLLIQGQSMEPTYQHMQIVLLDKTEKEYKRGDCVLFYCKELECSLVKRIVALPGESVQIYDGHLYINGKLTQPFSGCPEIEYAGLAAYKFTVPENCYFVLGDNFNQSRDSRYEDVGLVRAEEILGKII